MAEPSDVSDCVKLAVADLEYKEWFGVDGEDSQSLVV
jgi:hypothetical protein